ncbi:antitoxin of toxin-antitoxin stability system [Xanthobacter autotrophicus]|uniref:antitoxin of toxin-antitoxin stability system n=1 Tax=Xanthobacter autotrophicus TaxID=280 RepID=UPI0037280C8D
MPETIETIVYRLDELSEAAKERARAWYRNCAFDDDWFEFIFDNFEHVCAILGITLATRAVRLQGGGARREPCIWFSGCWNQGDGACFEGEYEYAKAAPRKIRAYAPRDAELHRIADTLQAIQCRNFYQLYGNVRHCGRSYHEGSMAISVERDSPTYQDMTADAEDAVSEALRNLARWLYRQLEREFEYLTSDEQVDEAIRANGYTFTETGRRCG